PAAVTGSPSLSLPGGFVDDLPVGITVLGRRGQDRQVLDFAAALERLLPPRRDPDLS
ncbi:MAG: amidase, partial [Frankiales bacterium]|nr:amidase [Frankiales bacterium]